MQPIVSVRQHDRLAPARDAASDRGAASHAVTVAGATLLLDLSGAIFWADQRLLIVADLHLEKGSSLAARGIPLPPYDTAATLERLGDVVGRYGPNTVIALGDSFHDGEGPARLSEDDRSQLLALQRGRDWIWIVGNHDPDPHRGVGGAFAGAITCGPLAFRHEPGQPCPPGSGEIAGHLHPCACVVRRGRGLSRRCFAADGRRLVMPAFGAFTGGLNIRDAAFRPLFDDLGFSAHLIGDKRIFTVAARRCAG